jgi:hypothetical protein
MKLADHIIAIARAFDELQHELHLNDRPDLAFNYRPRRQGHILPRERQYQRAPRLPTEHPPMSVAGEHFNKEKLLKLAAFEATFHGAKTPLSPDMVPLIIDTGASVSISPYKTDFTTPIRPVQQIQIKGIASGLSVAGIGDMSFTFTNDHGEHQTVLLKDSLYVPHCTVRLLCPRQIGAVTCNKLDGFNALSDDPILTVDGKRTTITYDSISQLPLLYTNPGISTYQRYICNLTLMKPTTNQTNELINLSRNQRLKLHLHEACAHERFTNLNRWIREGRIPGISPALAAETDPVCTICNFGKARRKPHKSHTGHIKKDHKNPGDGVSSDQLEAGTPGRLHLQQKDLQPTFVTNMLISGLITALVLYI